MLNIFDVYWIPSQATLGIKFGELHIQERICAPYQITDVPSISMAISKNILHLINAFHEALNRCDGQLLLTAKIPRDNQLSNTQLPNIIIQDKLDLILEKLDHIGSEHLNEETKKTV